jgi:hypothetical protein
MTARTVIAVVGLLTAGTLAGCGTRPVSTVPAAAAAAAPPLATSFADSAGSGWSVVEMGGPAAQHDNFWELFVRSPGAAPWRLATPVGVADNGGLVIAGTGRGTLVTGFRPSQDLTFSPLAATGDDGATWSPSSPVNPGLADAPDALAAGPGGRLLALTTGGGAELGTVKGDGEAGGAAWTHLSSVKALAATPAGRACRPTGLTAAAFGSSGAPMLAASCGRPGVAGIFTDSHGGWRAGGPAVPAGLGRQDIEVLALAGEPPGVVALLRAGTGRDASVTAAWSDGGRWTLSAPLRAGAGPVLSTAIGPGGAVGVILSPGRGATLAGPGASWRALPALPRWTATLALGPGGRADAIAAHLGTFWDWRTGSGTGGWSLAQTIRVTIPYGSSG